MKSGKYVYKVIKWAISTHSQNTEQKYGLDHAHSPVLSRDYDQKKLRIFMRRAVLYIGLQANFNFIHLSSAKKIGYS